MHHPSLQQPRPRITELLPVDRPEDAAAEQEKYTYYEP